MKWIGGDVHFSRNQEHIIHCEEILHDGYCLLYKKAIHNLEECNTCSASNWKTK